jgi:hypothetical protein
MASAVIGDAHPQLLRDLQVVRAVADGRTSICAGKTEVQDLVTVSAAWK